MKQRKTKRLLLTLASIVLSALTASAEDPPGLAGRPLAEGLRQLEARGLKLVFSSQLVRPDMRVEGNPKGSTPRQLLTEMLAPHGLAAAPGPGGRLMVVKAAEAEPGAATLSGQVTTKADGLSMPGATVSVDAFNRSAVTDAEGRYTLALPAEAVGRTIEIRVTAPGLKAHAETMTISTAGPVKRDFALSLPGLAEVVTVLGSRAGAAAERAVPVDAFTPQQIEAVQTTETAQIIQTLSPSFNFPRPTITDGTDTVRPATLRGLGPDQVLVLVNGRRRHTSALVHVNGSVGRGSTGVDLNAIPHSAVHTVQILRDGAAAQYGSDAIAGVIDIGLKSGKQPLTLSVKGMGTLTDQGNDGGETTTDGETIDVSATYGFQVGRGSVFVAGEFRDRKETNRAGADPRDQIRVGDGRNNAVPQPNHHWGDADARDYLSFVNASWPLNANETTLLYAFGGHSRRHASHGGFYRRGLDDRNWPEIYPLGFLPLIEPKVADSSGTVGVRGFKGEWFGDLSAQYGYNSFHFYVSNSLNTSLGPAAPPNQTSFDCGALAFGQWMVNLDVVRKIDAGLAGPLNVAFGAELRRESYEIMAGEPASYIDGGRPNQFGRKAAPGAQVFPGFKPENEVDASRNNAALYADLEADIVQRLRVGLAGRFEHYDDFGSTLDGKITVRIEPHKRLAIRAATSTGFRAPSLAQSWFTATSTNFLVDPATGQQAPFEIGTFAVESQVARALGGQVLEPERSMHVSAGIAANPTDDIEVTADYYRISIDDRIVLSGNFTGGKIQTLLAPFGVSGARFFTNSIDTRTQGLDLTAAWRWGLGNAGTLRLSGAYNTGLGMNTGKNDETRHYGTKIVSAVSTPPQLTGLEQVLFDKVERRRMQCGQPKDNVRLTATWQRKGLSGVLRSNRYGELCSADRAVVDQVYDPKWVTDLELAYSTDRLTIGIGSQNVLDVYPDRNLPQNSFNGTFPYTAISPFGFNGRFLYAKASVKF